MAHFLIKAVREQQVWINVEADNIGLALCDAEGKIQDHTIFTADSCTDEPRVVSVFERTADEVGEDKS